MNKNAKDGTVKVEFHLIGVTDVIPFDVLKNKVNTFKLGSVHKVEDVNIARYGYGYSLTVISILTTEKYKNYTVGFLKSMFESLDFTVKEFKKYMKDADGVIYAFSVTTNNSTIDIGSITGFIPNEKKKILPLNPEEGIYKIPTDKWYNPKLDHPSETTDIITPQSMGTAYKTLLRTFTEKNNDYGNSFEESLDEFGTVAGVVRLSDKFNRLKTLVYNPDEQQVKDESVADTLFDMANYATMLAVYINGKKGLK